MSRVKNQPTDDSAAGAAETVQETEAAAPEPVLERPAEGGSYIRLPDGRLERQKEA